MITLKKLIAVSVMVPMMALGGCAGGSAVLQNDLATIEAQAQADANILCGFIPTIATVAAFIPSFGAVAASAATIAEGVCAAIAKAPVVQPASARLRANLAASGADVQVATARTPHGPVAIVGHFTR